MSRPSVEFELSAHDYEQVALAAQLSGLTMREYIVRAINRRMCEQGVDAVLIAERETVRK